MKIRQLHGWQVNAGHAREIQRRLAAQVLVNGEVTSPRLIAGVDISGQKAQGVARGAVVVLDYPGLELVEVGVAERKLDFPYVPGLLSFREAPLILAACEKLAAIPDIILVDGQGIAHPRRMGLASHLGLFLDTPTIGCAKSILCGRHQPLGIEPGCYAELVDGDEVIGAAVRTKAGVKPIYVSIGHKVDLPTAIHWVMECCRGYRLPEPTRLAHLAAGGQISEKTVEKVPMGDVSQGELFL
mgnify:CR=1 FL=1